MYQCKSGNHTWTQKEDAEKCCNGYIRCLAVGNLPQEAKHIRSITFARTGFYWKKLEKSNS
jgi:hypothetical protein